MWLSPPQSRDGSTAFSMPEPPRSCPLDTAAGQVLGRMYAIPALKSFFTSSPRARQAKTGADLAIAAIAIARQAVVATSNVADFCVIHRHFALPGLLNLLTGEWHVPPAGDTTPK
jgi:toxin FitB